MTTGNTNLPVEITGQFIVVPTLADLPPGQPEGATRYVDADKHLYIYDGTAWVIQDSGTLPPPAAIGGPLGGSTPGSVLFVGAGGTFAQDNANFFWDNSNKALGVDTNTPSSPFQVSITNTSGGVTGVGISVRNEDLTNGNNAGFAMITKDSAAANVRAIGLLAQVQNHTAGAVTADFLITTRNAGVQAEVLRLLANGNLGLGTSTPTSKLTVVGSIASTSGGFVFPDATVQTTAATSAAIGGTIVGSTEGSVLFVGPGGVLAEDNAAFFWDDSTLRLHVNGDVYGNTFNSAGSIDLVLKPGHFFGIYAESDSATVIGAARGGRAIDLQLDRALSSQVAAAQSSFLGAGINNSIISTASYAAIVAGKLNQANASSGFIGGGTGNQITTAAEVGDFVTSSSAIVAGNSNVVAKSRSFIGAGNANNVSGGFSAIIAGDTNSVASLYSIVGSGQSNSIVATAQNSFMGSGQFNNINSQFSVVAGGSSNQIAAQFSIIGGGRLNSTSGLSNAVNESILGGISNAIYATNSTIVGGNNNSNSGTASFVGGGTLNIMTGNASTVSGGGNWVSGNNSSSFGVGNWSINNFATSFGRGGKTSANSDFVLGNDANALVGQASIDGTHFRVDGGTSNVHIGRPTDQPSADVTQAVTITIASPSVLTVAAAPANGSTVVLTTGGTLPTSTSQTVTIVAGIDVATTFTVGTAVNNGVQVNLATTGLLPAGFTPGTPYYVVGASGTSFNLALIPNGAGLIGSAVFQSGTHTATFSGFIAGNSGGTGQRYYVVNSAGTTFNLSYITGGPAISMYGTQSGSHSAVTHTYNNGSAQNKLLLHTTNPTHQSQTTNISASPSQTASYDIILPPAQGSSGNTLSNNGSGVLSWVAPTAAPAIGGPLTGVTTGSVLFGSGGNFAQNNANFFWDNTSHRLGIGTNAPDTPLYVVGPAAGTALTLTDQTNGTLRFSFPAASTTAIASATGQVIALGSQNTAGGSFTERMRVDTVTGNVGIGTAAPVAQLSAGSNTFLVTEGATVLQPVSSLTGAGDTSIPVFDVTGFPTSGILVTRSELITYTGITGTTFTGCTRGAFGTTATILDPDNSDTVSNVVFLKASNTTSVDMFITGDGTQRIGQPVNGNDAAPISFAPRGSSVGTFTASSLNSTTITGVVPAGVTSAGAGVFGVDEPTNTHAAFTASTVGSGAALSLRSGSGPVLLLSDSANDATISISVPALASVSYSLTLPSAQGAASTVLTNNGSGVLSWAPPSKTFTVSTISSNTTAAVNTTYFADTSGGTFTLTLPAPSAGAFVFVKDKTGSFQTNNLTVAQHAAEKIEGLAASKLLQTAWGSFGFVSDGTDWYMGGF